MTKKQELEIVKELIKDGYDNLDTISFELDIPINTLKQIQQQIQKEKLAVVQNNFYISSRIQTMKEKYNWIFYLTSSSNTKEQKNEINEEVDKSISEIINISSRENAIDRAFEIVKILKKIDNEKFSEGQIEKIISILYNSKIFYVPPSTQTSNLIRTMQKYKQRYVVRLVEEIKSKRNSVTDISELKRLKSLITPEMEKEFPICVGPVKMQLDSKISRLNSQNMLNNFENNISKLTREIALKLTGGDVDIDSIEKDVESEIDNRMRGATNSRFSLDRNHQKEQIFYQVGALIKTQADKYEIVDEDKTMHALGAIFGKDYVSSLQVIVNNYIRRKEYKKAYNLCDKYNSSELEYGAIAKRINALRQSIKCAEIGDIVLRGLNANASEEELNNFKNAIQNEIKKYGLKPSSIPLGKNKDNTRDITLADIMSDGKELF